MLLGWGTFQMIELNITITTMPKSVQKRLAKIVWDITILLLEETMVAQVLSGVDCGIERFYSCANP